MAVETSQTIEADLMIYPLSPSSTTHADTDLGAPSFNAAAASLAAATTTTTTAVRATTYSASDRSPPVSKRPAMISIGEHEAIVARERERIEDRERSKHATAIRRLEGEIERLKALVENAKNSTKQIKRKTPKELKGAGKGARHKFGGTAGAQSVAPGRKHDARWQARFEDLKAYKEMHGHCNVDNKDDEIKELRLWCQTQRQMYSKLVHGHETTLTTERIRLLNSIRFKWTLKKTECLKWEERFEQLKQFHTRHGHIRIPQKLDESPGLGNWVLEQRRRYREMFLPESERTRGKGTLTREQIDMLEALGFEWSVRNRNGGK